MHYYFVNLNCTMLLNIMCCVDDDELGWDPGWLDRVVKWNWKCNIILSITWDLLVYGRLRWNFGRNFGRTYIKKITENFQCIAKKNIENQGCYNRRVISITINLVHKTSLI